MAWNRGLVFPEGTRCQWYRVTKYRPNDAAQCPKPAGRAVGPLPIPLCDYHRAKAQTTGRNGEARQRWRESRRKEAEQHSVVYFVRRGDGAIKIGLTTNLTQRMDAFNHVHPVTLLGTMPGHREVERSLHARFAAHRLHGEWFTASPDLLAFIAEQQNRAA